MLYHMHPYGLTAITIANPILIPCGNTYVNMRMDTINERHTLCDIACQSVHQIAPIVHACKYIEVCIYGGVER